MPKYWGKQIFTHGSFPEVGQKQKTEREKRENTPGTAGGPGGRDRTLAVKQKKLHIYLLLMPKYWGKQIFAHVRFLKVGQKQKTVKRKRKKD